MFSYIGMNLRKGGERRIWNVEPELNTRRIDRRYRGANSYFLVMGNGGIDNLSAACLVAMLLVVMVVTI